MEEIWIVTRDANGKRTNHYMHWDDAYKYIQENVTDEDETMLVIIEGTCVFSGLGHKFVRLEDLLGFFA